MNGARTSACCFNTDVGIGSAADCLSGSWRIALVTSSVVNAEKCRKDAPAGAQLNVAGGASLVLDRTLATFSVKNWLNAWTSIAVLAGTLPRPSSPSTIRHSCRGSDALAGPKVSTLAMTQLTIHSSLSVPRSLALHDVFRTVVIAKLCSASSVRQGFSTAGDI